MKYVRWALFGLPVGVLVAQWTSATWRMSAGAGQDLVPIRESSPALWWVGWILCEVLALLVALRPWDARRAPYRTALGWVLFVPLALGAMATASAGDSFVLIHIFWLSTVNVTIGLQVLLDVRTVSTDDPDRGMDES